jgi:hypothetical protein
MAQAAARFLKVIAGRCSSARVTVSVVGRGIGPGVVVADDVFRALDAACGYGLRSHDGEYDNRLREAAVRGAEYALAEVSSSQEGSGRGIRIEDITFLLVDVTPAAVAYAACRATWDAFGEQKQLEPTIENGQLIFPGVSG